MDNTWRLIDSGQCTAFHNMALDEAIAMSVRKGSSPPTLRLYGWDRPALTLGCFQKASDVDLDYCRAKEIPVVRRPTGGRAILHGDELTYSFSAKTDSGPFSTGLLESYRMISAAFHLVFSKAGVHAESKKKREKGRVLAGSPLCFQSSSFGEILIDNRKAVGSAQKRWEDGFLQQGSIPYRCDEDETSRVFGAERFTALKTAMIELKKIIPLMDEEEFRRTIRVSFEETFGISFLFSHPAPEEMSLAGDLEKEKYSQDSWNLQR